MILKLNFVLNYYIIGCLAILSSSNIRAAENTRQLITKIGTLKEESYQISPVYNTEIIKRNQSEAKKWNRFSTHLPQLYLQAQKKHDYYENSNEFLRSLGVTKPDYELSINYEWSIFDRTKYLQTKQSVTEDNIQEINASNAVKEYETQFTTLVLDYLLSKYKSAAIANSLQKAQTAKREAQLGFELGHKTKIDVLRADANLISLNSKKTTYEDEEQKSKSTLIEKSGLDESKFIFLNNLEENEYLTLIKDLSVYQPITTNVNTEQTIDYKKLNEEISLNQSQAKLITAKDWPLIKIEGSLSQTSDTFSGTYHQPDRDHIVALSVTIPLFNSGGTIASQFEEYYATRVIDYQKRLKIQGLDHQLKNAVIKISALCSQVKSLEKNVEQFEELSRLTTKSYQLGKSTLLELLESHDRLLESKILLAENKIQLYQIAETYNRQTKTQ